MAGDQTSVFNLRKDPQVMGVVWMALLVLVESVQMVIALGFISIFVPAKPDAFNSEIFPAYQSSIKSSPQMLIYHIFIVAAILAQGTALYAFRRKLAEEGFQEGLKKLLFAEALWVAVQCYAIFKILVYNGQGWAWGMFYASMAASVLSRIFWAEILRGWEKWMSFLKVDSRIPIISAGIQGTFWLALFVLVEAVQMVIGSNWLLGLMGQVQPVLLFAIFMSSALFFWWGTTLKRINMEQHKAFIIAESLLTFFLLSALFKMVIYDYRSLLATRAYHVVLVLAVLNKICWPQAWMTARRLWARMKDPHNLPALRPLADILFIVFIILTISLRDPQAVLAKMFIGDEFIHTNCFVMAPGWAYVKGCLLDVDIMSRYGLGIPIVLATLAKWLGGYNYLNVLLAVLVVTIVYYILCYLFLRLWLRSFILSASAILVGIKTQMFFTLSFPQPLTYTGTTPVRFMLDIVFMLCILTHIRSRRWPYLLLAALCCGTTFFCTPETGIYLFFAFYAYLILAGMLPGLRAEIYGPKRMATLFSALAGPGSAWLLMWFYLGEHLYKQEFWYHFTEISKLYTHGLWTGPFYGGLQYGQFWDLLIGMAFPMVYILTILIIGTLCVLRKLPQEHAMAVVLAFYGLGAHHYYVVMATANNYYPRGLPFVFLVFYWMGLGLASLSKDTRRRVGAALLAFCAYCLWTNHHYLSYPNIFNFSRNPMIDPMVAERLPDGRYYFNHRYINYDESLKVPVNSLGEKEEDLKTEKDFSSDEQLKAYYRKETDFSQDVRLIHSLAGRQQPVALLSSYETEMLMQADRKPFFYYFRAMCSRPLRMRSFGNMDMFTKTEMNNLIAQMETTHLKYLFMERVFLQKLSPRQYANYDPALMGLLDYVKSRYQPYAYGKFLVAMKRVGP